MDEQNRECRSVLMVDDEENFLLTASLSLKSAGFENVYTLSDSREVMPFLEKICPCVIILDLTMPHLTGRDLLARITVEHPGTPVVILTAYDDLNTAVQCLKEGAKDYLVKPVEESRFIASIGSAMELVQLRQEVDSLKTQFLDGEPVADRAFRPIVTRSDRIKALFKYIRAIGPSFHPVLITGETGTGKELFARAVHDLSGRSGDFIAVNVAGLDDTHFTDTLFGHEKGAYTGAERARDGLVSKAADGTLFLDEIGDLPESSQVKLLRLLQEKQYYPLGSDVLKCSRARIIVATNRDVGKLVSKGKYRKDLYFRLKIHEIFIPPLRERPGDLPLLLDYFLEKTAVSMGRKVPSYPGQLLTVLRNYHFPGNVRELEAMVADAVARHQSGVLSMTAFKQAISQERDLSSGVYSDFDAEDADRSGGWRFSISGVFPTIREVEEYLIRVAMDRSGGNQTIAAELLGITRQTLSKRLEKTWKKN